MDQHSGGLIILILSVLVLGTLLIVVPQLLRLYRHSVELQHAERMRALEQGFGLPLQTDYRSEAAGRTAFLVPIVVVCVAGTVTCFLIAFKTDNAFAVALTVWSVAGVVGLAAITGGVALMGRLEQLKRGIGEEEEEEAPQVSE